MQFPGISENKSVLCLNTTMAIEKKRTTAYRLPFPAVIDPKYVLSQAPSDTNHRKSKPFGHIDAQPRLMQVSHGT
jgi:hypothetical protein